MDIITLLTIMVLLYFLIKNRSNLIATVAEYRYGMGHAESALKMYAFANKFGRLKFPHKVRHAYFTLKEGDVEGANRLFNLLAMEKLKPEERAVLKSSHALVMWKTGNVADAIEMLEYVSANFPSTTCYGSLGYMYAYSGNLHRALEYNKEAYEYNNTDPIIVDNIAYTYLQLKDYENAEKYYKELFALDPKFPEGYFEYGKYLVSKGERQEGIELVKKALNSRYSFLSMFTRRDVLDYLESQGEDISTLV